jgi:hypothetical protein
MTSSVSVNGLCRAGQRARNSEWQPRLEDTRSCARPQCAAGFVYDVVPYVGVSAWNRWVEELSANSVRAPFHR